MTIMSDHNTQDRPEQSPSYDVEIGKGAAFVSPQQMNALIPPANPLPAPTSSNSSSASSSRASPAPKK
jgi:hypothetical protein